MPRAWAEKTKTGCVTCRARKVKCDQGKPSCSRCVSTGRRCGGYKAVPTGWYSWNQLLSSTAPIPISPRSRNVSEPQARAIEYYQHVAASGLSTWFDGSFWSNVVVQVSMSNIAVRDMLIAISTIFERQSVCRGRYVMNQGFALHHYNRALRALGTSPNADVNSALVSCILFVCLESFLGSQQSFIAHGDHGIRILNTLPTMNQWARSHVLPIFLRMDIGHLFMQKRSAPSLKPELVWCLGDIQGPFTSFQQARHELDKIFSRAIRTIRLNVDDSQRSQRSSDEQRELHQLLDSWNHLYDKALFAPAEAQEDRDARAVLRVIYLMSSIWIDVMMDDTEMKYDDHEAHFEEIISLAQAAGDKRFGEAMTGESCNFDVEILPLLYYSVIKCRRLDLRLRGLKVMEASPTVRKNEWDSRIFYLAACRVIEMEHGLRLKQLKSSAPGSDEIPLREKRVSCVNISQMETKFEGRYGVTPMGRKVTMIVSNLEGLGNHMVFWVLM